MKVRTTISDAGSTPAVSTRMQEIKFVPVAQASLDRARPADWLLHSGGDAMASTGLDGRAGSIRMPRAVVQAVTAENLNVKNNVLTMRSRFVPAVNDGMNDLAYAA